MARRRTISKSRSSTRNDTQPDNTTPFSTGLFGHLLTGSVVNCNAEDNSFFCKLTKVFNGLIMIIGILLILYLIYHYGKMFFFNKRK